MRWVYSKGWTRCGLGRWAVNGMDGIERCGGRRWFRDGDIFGGRRNTGVDGSDEEGEGGRVSGRRWESRLR
jgi:hypothetical protein